MTAEADPRREEPGSPDQRWTDLNRLLWDERAPAHAASPDYALTRYAQDPGHLSDEILFDRARLGDCAVSTCSATSGPTPSRCTASARG